MTENNFSYDEIYSMKFIHDCEEKKVSTTISGHEAYMERTGLLEMVLIADIFVGKCQTCGSVYHVHFDDMRRELGPVEVVNRLVLDKWPHLVNLLRLVVEEHLDRGLTDGTFGRAERFLKELPLSPNP